MDFDGTIDYFRDTVFNYPTMAECYKVAALDGLNKLSLLNEIDSLLLDDRPARSGHRHVAAAGLSGLTAWCVPRVF